MWNKNQSYLERQLKPRNWGFGGSSSTEPSSPMALSTSLFSCSLSSSLHSSSLLCFPKTRSPSFTSTLGNSTRHANFVVRSSYSEMGSSPDPIEFRFISFLLLFGSPTSCLYKCFCGTTMVIVVVENIICW